jgi:predicted nucleic acid-binding protein
MRRSSCHPGYGAVSTDSSGALCEVLQGLASKRAAREVEGLPHRFEIAAMAGDAIAVLAARYFRSLRRRGIAIRKTIDLVIGTWCIENRRPMLHNDSDFWTAIFARWLVISGLSKSRACRNPGLVEEPA